MLSPFTEHLLVLGDEGVFWSTGKNLLQPDFKWQQYAVGDPLGACAALLDQAPRVALPFMDRATLVLGFPHVHYLVVPWQENLYRTLDWKSFARALFSQQSSVDPEQWEIEIDHAPFGTPRLAVAVSKDLLADLRALLKAKQLVIDSCNPLLTFALHRYRKNFPDDYVLAVREANSLSCLFVHQGQPTHASALPVRAHALLRDSLIAADLLSGDQAQETLVVAASNDFLLEPHTQPWRWLGPLHPWLATTP